MKLPGLMITVIKKSRLVLAIAIILAAIVISVFRALTPWAKQYKSDVERYLTTVIGQPVAVKNMETSWYWFEPVLKLEEVTLIASSSQNLKLDKLLIGIDLISSLWHRRFEPGVLYIDNANLVLHQQNNKRWSVDGLKQSTSDVSLNASYLPVLSWLLSQEKLIIKHVSALLYLNDGTRWSISDIHFTEVNSFGHYRFKGSAVLQQKKPTRVAFVADLKIDALTLNQISGRAYLSLQQVDAEPIQEWLPKFEFSLKKGVANLEVWLDFSNGRVSAVQSVVSFKQLLLSKQGLAKDYIIPKLQANLAWNTTRDGWQFSADNIHLVLPNPQNSKTENTSLKARFRTSAQVDVWPENKLLLTYKQADDAYHVYVQSLSLEQLLRVNMPWPELLQPLLKWHLSGKLHDLQMDIKAQQISYFLTRFDNLSWKAQGELPGVKNLSGVLHWEPDEGRLELESKNTTVLAQGVPPVILQQINAAVDWKLLSDGLRLSLDRLVLIHPDLLLSARGAIDGPTASSLSNLRFAAEFSGQHAERWIQYIPGRYFKPKFDDWLKQDIRSSGKFSGQMQINGPIAQFPFDDQSGQFVINASVNGVSLRFNKNWPLNHDVDARISVNKRLFQADITHGVLKDIELEAANLRIDNIGLGRETLLIHGLLQTPGEKVKDYISNSPLKTTLSKLKSISIKNQLGLDLALEVPLYPENDRILAKGTLKFDQNQLFFNFLPSDVSVDNLTGLLHFTDQGVSASELQGTVAGEPLLLHILSTDNSERAQTTIQMESSSNSNWLREHFALSMFNVMQGHFQLNGLMTLSNDPKALDHIHLETDAKGISVNLPDPLGKSVDQTALSTLDLDFGAKHATDLRINYDNRLLAHLIWPAAQTQMPSGEFVIGGKLTETTSLSPGITVRGSLDKFNLKEWRRVWPRVAGQGSGAMFDALRDINLKLAQVSVLDKVYTNLSFRAVKINREVWSLALKQQHIDADLRYNLSSNTLSGHAHYLALNDLSWLKHNNANSAIHLKPKSIPNLDIAIDALKLGNIEVGGVAVKSTSQDESWTLEHGDVTTDDYKFTAQGVWTQSKQQEDTKMQASLQIKDLAKALQRWSISPVIEAQRGDIQFDGGWPGSIDEFALQKVHGALTMTVKDGRITHLSSDTEKKIGLGKLLSIVSLQTIPRRLKLDFRDLSQHGYTFDIYTGNFTLNHGVLTTQDSYIDGPVAYASIKGDLDLIKRLYDLDLRVTPYITASLPVVATIAGGPVAGIATWVASKIINKGMQQISGYTYKVSGPWMDPVVQQVGIYKKK